MICVLVECEKGLHCCWICNLCLAFGRSAWLLLLRKRWFASPHLDSLPIHHASSFHSTFSVRTLLPHSEPRLTHRSTFTSCLRARFHRPILLLVPFPNLILSAIITNRLPPHSPESAFRSVNLAIFSNSKNFRRDPNVPLVVPLVNTHHLAMIPQQQRLLSQSSSSSATGFIVTNANCSTTGIVVPIHALEKAFGPVDAVVVSTMQAISGAGYPGLSAMDVMDNVVPYIDGEEEKVEWEMLKILGGMREASSPTDELGRELEFDMRASTPLRVSASCNRVPVIDGHTACVSIRFARRPPPSPQQVREALSAFIPALPSSSLFTTSPSTSPSSSSITSPPVPSMFPPSPSLNPYTSLPPPSFPSPAIVVHSSNDRPQPRLDRYAQDGACVHVGRVRQCPVLDVKFVVLANNVSLGAASGSIMNAEVGVVRGLVAV